MLCLATGPGLPARAAAADLARSFDLLFALALADSAPPAATAVPADSAVLDSTGQAGTVAAAAPAEFADPDRRRAFSDLKPGREALRGVRTLASDFAAVVTGPLHMDRQDAFWTLGFLAVTGALYAYDEEVLAGIHRSRENVVYDKVVEPGRALEKVGFIGATAPYYAAGFLIGYVFRIEPLTTMIAEAAESHFIAGFVRNAVEVTAGRSRPREGQGPRDFGFRQSDSFPSGHASVVFEVATIVAHHVESKPLRVLCYALATSISLQRLDSNSHWPSDIFVGATIGTVVARAIVRRHEAAREARAAARAVPSP